MAIALLRSLLVGKFAQSKFNLALLYTSSALLVSQNLDVASVSRGPILSPYMCCTLCSTLPEVDCIGILDVESRSEAK